MKRKNLLFCFLIFLIILAIVIGIIMFVNSREKREPIPKACNPCQPTVALTFDDGPNACYTPQVLDILYKYQVPATFFLVGENVKNNENLIREMQSSGHEIELHSFSHPDLTTLCCREIQCEFQQAENSIQEILPEYSANYFRPPYGRYTEETEEIVGLPMILWTLDSGDWESPDSREIVNTVLNYVKGGDIIIFHDDNPETVKALDELIPELKKRGFEFTTVQDN